MSSSSISHQAQVAALLKQYVSVLDALTELNVCRTGNNPTGDYTEWLVAQRLGLKLTANSRRGYDAFTGGTDTAPEKRYQIKGRRHKKNTSWTQFGTLRDLEANQFDELIVVVFKSDFTVNYALQLPHAVVTELAKENPYVNGYKFIIRNSLLSEVKEMPGVKDITAQLA